MFMSGRPSREDLISAGGHKDDSGKVRMDLIPPELLVAVGDVLTFGAKKYKTEITNEWDALLYARFATELQVITPKGSVVSVTRNTSVSPIPSMQNASVKIAEIGSPETQTRCESWQSVDALIRQHVQGIKEPSGSIPCGITDSPKKYTLTYAPKGAPSAALPNTCTLTIVTEQGNLEVSFVHGATMDSDFWTTVWKALKERFGISRPLNRVGDRNWEHGMKWSRPFGALMRHMWAWWGGEPSDPETGRSHLWHAACCIAFLIAYEERGDGEDDRWKGPLA